MLCLRSDMPPPDQMTETALDALRAEAPDGLMCFSDQCIQLTADLQGLPGQNETARDLAAELNGHFEFWREVRQRLSHCIHQADAASVHWISGGGRFRAAWLNSAPLETATILRERLFEAPEATILVSATLAIGGSFTYVKQRLGLKAGERIAGFIYIGTPAEELEERPRPDMEKIVNFF